MLRFLLDFFKYPFDTQNPENRFGKAMTTLFKEYPAFFWQKPSWKKVLVFPFLVVYAIFRRK
jgi:hypothetical protein